MAGAQKLEDFTGPCPCDDCRLRHRCAVERTACAAWSMFFHGDARWQNAPRAPSRAVWLATVGDEPRKLGRPRKRAS